MHQLAALSLVLFNCLWALTRALCYPPLAELLSGCPSDEYTALSKKNLGQLSFVFYTQHFQNKTDFLCKHIIMSSIQCIFQISFWYAAAIWILLLECFTQHFSLWNFSLFIMDPLSSLPRPFWILLLCPLRLLLTLPRQEHLQASQADFYLLHPDRWSNYCLQMGKEEFLQGDVKVMSGRSTSVTIP